MVLISFMPNDPREPSRTVGFSNNAAVCRKPAGASDAEYVRLDDPHQPLAPLNRDQIHEMMLKFQGPEAAAGQPAPAAPNAPTGRGPLGLPVPEAVKEIPSPRPGGAERAGGEPAPGSFVFLDQTVDDGESYVYKIYTLSTALDVEPVPCKDPYVSAPIFVPSLVEFTVRAIAGDRAAVRIIRRDPDTGEWLAPQDFTVGVGMKIGGMVTLKLPQLPEMPPKTKDVDFSTGCLLVNTLPLFPLVEYNKLRLVRVENIYTVVYRARYARDPRILYLTPRGGLHFKSKEKERQSPAFP
jgi:hypothetical protein